MNDDLLALANIARLACPSHRQTNVKAKNCDESNPVIRCVCKSSKNTDSLITCTQCKCQLHVSCLDEDNDEEDPNWICPFCKAQSTQILIDNQIDIEKMHCEVKKYQESRHCDNIIAAAQTIQAANEELHKASKWLSMLSARDDIYQSLADLADDCMDNKASAMAVNELTHERNMLKELSQLFEYIADESDQNQDPLLNALTEQVITHATDNN